MNDRLLWLLSSSIIALAAFGCGVLAPESGSVPEDLAIIPSAHQPSDGSTAFSQPVVEESSATGVSEALVGDDGEVVGVRDSAVVEVVPSGPAEVPSGAIALFYRASFGSETRNLKTVVTGTRDEGNLGIADISWDSGSKGIVRFIPGTGQTDVIKTIVSTSYSKSSIYPVTVGDRLYAIRDWGSDWTVDNKRFTVEELDPQTGATLSSTDIVGEWLTVLDDQVFFQSALTQDFWTGSKSGGMLRVKTQGDSVERDLAVEGVRLYAVGDRLLSAGQQEIRWHDATTGEVQSTSYLEALSIEDAWPDPRHLFFGDSSMFWVSSENESPQISIIRAQANEAPEVLVTFDLEGYETGLVVDEHEDKVMIAFTGSVPPRGIGITEIFIIDTNTDGVTKLPVEQYIPSAQPDAGGGLQLLVMP